VPSEEEVRHIERLTNRTLERIERDGQRQSGPFTIETFFHVLQNNNGAGEQQSDGPVCVWFLAGSFGTVPGSTTTKPAASLRARFPTCS
jgi:hypothetical protein